MVSESKRPLLYATALILVFIVVVFIGLLYLFLFRSNPSTSQQGLQYKVENFGERDIYTLEVEFTSTPYLQVSYQADAIVISDKNRKSFSVFSGPPEGQVNAGTCEYNELDKKFTGNNTWRLMNTKELISLIKPGKKAVLRFYKPKTFTSPEESEYSASRFAFLDEFLQEVNSINSFSKQYFLVPDELCVS